MRPLCPHLTAGASVGSMNACACFTPVVAAVTHLHGAAHDVVACGHAAVQRERGRSAVVCTHPGGLPAPVTGKALPGCGRCTTPTLATLVPVHDAAAVLAGASS